MQEWLVHFEIQSYRFMSLRKPDRQIYQAAEEPLGHPTVSFRECPQMLRCLKLTLFTDLLRKVLGNSGFLLFLSLTQQGVGVTMTITVWWHSSKTGQGAPHFSPTAVQMSKRGKEITENAANLYGHTTLNAPSSSDLGKCWDLTGLLRGAWGISRVC